MSTKIHVKSRTAICNQIILHENNDKTKPVKAEIHKSGDTFYITVFLNGVKQEHRFKNMSGHLVQIITTLIKNYDANIFDVLNLIYNCKYETKSKRRV